MDDEQYSTVEGDRIVKKKEVALNDRIPRFQEPEERKLSTDED